MYLIPDNAICQRDSSRSIVVQNSSEMGRVGGNCLLRQLILGFPVPVATVLSAMVLVVALWISVKAVRKLRAFGLTNLILCKLRALSLEGFGRGLLSAWGIRVDFVEMPFAEAPIDVDSQRTLGMARAIVKARGEGAWSSGGRDSA